MDILTFLTIVSVIGLGLLYMLTRVAQGQPALPALELSRLLPKKPAKQKIIRVHVDDAVENFICAVVGESFTNEDGKNRQDIIKRCAKVGMPAHLEREPENPYDSSAVAVYIADQQIGYLKADVAERLADKIDGGRYVAGAAIHKITGGTKSKPHFGVTLDLTVYLLRQS